MQFKHILLVAPLVAISTFGCTQNNQKEDSERNSSVTEVIISQTEQALLDSISFSHSTLRSIRSYTDSTVQRKLTVSYFYNDTTKSIENIDKKYNGIIFNSSSELAHKIVYELHDKLRVKGYLIYVSDENYGYSPDQVTILKSDDQFEILITEETAGYNYDIDNNNVISKLKEWSNQYPFKIIGAGQNWINAVFISPPSNMKKFSKEVYEFCPDIVDQGTGTVKELEKSMNMTNTLYLWWD